MYIIEDSKLKKDWVFKKGYKKLLHKILRFVGLGSKTIGASMINPSGSWKEIAHKIIVEYQRKAKLDIYGCVTYATQKCLEMLAWYKINILGDKLLEKVLNKFGCIVNGFPNFDNWFTVLMSGTIPYKGNSQRNVVESARIDGLLKQTFNFTNETTQSMYFDKSKITPENIAIAKELMKYININWEWVDRMFGKVYSSYTSLKGALTESPLLIVVGNGTHCECGVDVEEGKLESLNSYQGAEHKIYNSNKDWWYVIKFDITTKINQKMLDNFLKEYEGKFVKGDTSAIYLIKDGKKRAFASWFDYLAYDGGKGKHEKVDGLLLEFVDDGDLVDITESPYWNFISTKYEMLKEMSAPDNIDRLKNLLENTGIEEEKKPNNIWEKLNSWLFKKFKK